MSRILLTGSSSGLGRELSKALKSDGHEVVGLDRTSGYDVRNPTRVDGHVDVLINNAGVNDIFWLKDLKQEDWDRIMDTNAKAIYLMTQLHLDQLRESRGTVLNIVSNASHVPMRCSAAYNASKGAAAILTRQLARELSPDVTVFAVSPNKLKGTAMSDHIDERVVETRGWTLEQAQKYQLSSLLAGAETPVAEVADFITYLLSSKERHRYLTGCDIPYGA